MSFATAKNFRKWLNIGMAGALFIALLVSLLMMVEALQNSERFEHLYSTLLLINAVALLALFVLIILNLHHLLHQVYKQRAGARLTVRLVSLFVLLSTVPVVIVYYFSLEFLHQRLDNWFDIHIEQALTNALDLSRATLDTRMREALQQTQSIGEAIILDSKKSIALQLNQLRHNSRASELTLLTNNGHIVASNSIDLQSLLPNLPKKNILLQLKQSETMVNIESIEGQGRYIQVVIKLNQSHHPEYLLQALFPISERFYELAESIESAFVNYKERVYLQNPLKISFTLVLSLVLLLSLLSAVWMAFFVAYRFIAPLSDLLKGTQAVANGDYDKQIPIKQLDELGFLVQSFNKMTRQIARAQDEVKQSQQLADSQRAYLQAVLERLSSGVISVDYEQRLRTANPAAAQILELPLNELIGKTLIQLEKDYFSLHSLYSSIYPYLSSQVQDWRQEISLFGTSGRKVLICCGTQLQLSCINDQHTGYVIVFDDVTTLIQAQRNAAWSEVARRLAHEIKNPLTPIQLSAERLRHKYLSQLSDKEANTLDRMTHTIIQQVEAMKSMVNAFSDYAKTPSMHYQDLALNDLIKEVLDLYHHSPIPIQLVLDENIPTIEADRARLRQVLHNLIKNALEIQVEQNSLTITTRHLIKSTFECVELRVQDQGPGFPVHLQDKIFEPYVTTKVKGTGLGLAIVKKIIDEHSGMVWIENNPSACVIIRLPVVNQVSS